MMPETEVCVGCFREFHAPVPGKALLCRNCEGYLELLRAKCNALAMKFANIQWMAQGNDADGILGAMEAATKEAVGFSETLKKNGFDALEAMRALEGMEALKEQQDLARKMTGGGK